MEPIGQVSNPLSSQASPAKVTRQQGQAKAHALALMKEKV